MIDFSGRWIVSLGLLFGFLLLVSGCLGGYSGPPGNPNWSLSVIDIDTNQQDDYIKIQTTIGLQGQYGQNTQVLGTRVCAINDDGEILDTKDIGEVSSNSPRHNISFKLKEVPAIIALGYKSVDSPISHDLQGRKRVGEDRYRPFYQNRSRCSPSKLLQRSPALVVGNYFSKGWNDPVAYPPMDRDYVAFSIEELLTVEFNHIDSREE